MKDELLGKIEKYKIIIDPKKGQHFLFNEDILKLLVKNVQDGDTVIEIGPGLGQLTSYLANKAKEIIVIEIDHQFYLALKDISRKYKNVDIVWQDVLKANLPKIIRDKTKSNNKVKIVANIPYHITEPLLKTLLKIKNIEITMMVGKKFGYETLNSNLNENFFSTISFVTSLFFNVEMISDVKKDDFYPKPDTDSVILKLTPKNESKNKYEFLLQRIVLNESHGNLIKNAIINTLIAWGNKNNIKVTKNEAREELKSMKISESILNKSFAQLNNEEVHLLAKFLQPLSIK